MKSFNREKFVEFILQVIEARGLTRGQAEQQAGVYPTAITKMVTQRAGVKADTLLSLCAWAGSDPMNFFSSKEGH